MIKSATGTGKTTCTADLIERIRKYGDYKVLSIVSRVSLASQHKKNFESLGMVSYQDIEQHEYDDCQNLVIQLDSIIHLDLEKVGNTTILFLDEINSLIDYRLNSDTLANRRLQVYNAVCIIIGRAT